MKTCEECDKAFEPGSPAQRFCGRSCSGSFNGRKRIKHGRARSDRKCLDCEKIISHNSQGRCRDCAASRRGKNLLSDYLDGKWDGNVKHGLSSVVRAHIITIAGNMCQKCGWAEVNPVTGSVPVQVNHVDGDAFNNSPQNLEVLCPNCHSLTPNFGALNKNATRSYRYNKSMPA